MAGYGLYRNGNVTGPAGTATAGFGDSFAAGAVFGEDMYAHLSGEIRYLFQNGDPFVSAAGAQGSIRGQSHAIHYDLLIEARRREYRLRPYLIVGGGVKDYLTRGAAPAAQPIPQIVSLAARNQVSALWAAGAGVRYRLRDRVYVRADFLDYMTPFPKHLFPPAPGGSDHGILHQLTPTLGITFRL